MPLVHPYIACSELEHNVAAPLVVSDGRVGYADERPEDRDAQGILWNRQIMAPGQGAPRFGQIHTARQRHATLTLLCQVCGGDPDETAEGILWLLPMSGAGSIPHGPNLPVLSTYPPICAACCEQALRQCPPLRAGHLILRVGDIAPAGVLGRLHGPDGTPVTGQEEIFRYGDPRLPMVVAHQQALWLKDYRTGY